MKKLVHPSSFCSELPRPLSSYWSVYNSKFWGSVNPRNGIPCSVVHFKILEQHNGG